MKRLSRLLLLIPLLVAADALWLAEAAAQKRHALLLSDRPPPRRNCRMLPGPNPLPAVSQLADSAVLHGRVAELARQSPGSGHALYSVVFREDGSLDRVSTIEHSLPEGHAELLRGALRDAVRPQTGGLSSVRLRMEVRPDPVLRVGRSEQCPPASRTRFWVKAPAMFQIERPPLVRLRLWISADGRIETIRFLTGSGHHELDRYIENVLLTRGFMPGLLDEVAVPMEVEESVKVDTRL